MAEITNGASDSIAETPSLPAHTAVYNPNNLGEQTARLFKCQQPQSSVSNSDHSASIRSLVNTHPVSQQDKPACRCLEQTQYRRPSRRKRTRKTGSIVCRYGDVRRSGIEVRSSVNAPVLSLLKFRRTEQRPRAATTYVPSRRKTLSYMNLKSAKRAPQAMSNILYLRFWNPALGLGKG